MFVNLKDMCAVEYGTINVLNIDDSLLYYNIIPALRGEAALTARMPKEAKKNASISPYDKVIAETQWLRAFDGQVLERYPPCLGDLLQLTEKGAVID